MTDDKTAQARDLLAQALDIPADSVPADASIETVERWDSLAHMRVILALESVLATELDPATVFAIAGLADIAAILKPGRPTD